MTWRPDPRFVQWCQLVQKKQLFLKITCVLLTSLWHKFFLYMSYLHLWLASESSPYMLEAKKRTRCQQPKLSQPVQSFVVKRKTELILKVQKVAQFSVIMIIHMLSGLHHLKNIFYLNKTCILWHTMEQILLLLKNSASNCRKQNSECI